MHKPFLPALAALALALATGACTAHADGASPGGDYKKVSELVALPDFLPGMGTLYVQPATLPAGPFLAYDRNDRLVSTIYMIPLEDLEGQQAFEGLAVGGDAVESVDLHYNAGHPGVEKPHYHVVLWHVAKSDAALD